MPQQTDQNKHLWDQFCRLGEMMGDGLHHDPDGKWIEKEYSKLSRILCPEGHKEARIARNLARDKAMTELLTIKKSPCCNSQLAQSRKGALVCICNNCKKRYRIGKKK